MLETDLTTPFADFLRSSPNPLVSVVVVSFNKGAYLSETIESVLAQTYPRLEIVIVNDGSNDNTSDVASRYVTQRDDRTVLLLNKQNGGVSDARNAGLKRASARVVMTVDGDDVLTPKYIETAVSTLRDGSGDIFFSNQENFGREPGEWVPHQYDRFFIRYDNSIPVYSVFDKRLFELTGGFKVGLGYAEDWEFWVNCTRYNPVVVRSAEKLVRYRTNDQGIASSFIEGRWRDCVVMLMISNPGLYSVQEVVEAHLHYPNSAESSLARAVKLDTIHPQEPLLKFLLALQAEKRGDIQTALNLYLQALSLTKNDHWQAAYRAGEILRASGKKEDSMMLYHLVRILRPDMGSLLKSYFP